MAPDRAVRSDVAELDRIAGGIVDALENEADAVDITNDPL